MELQSYHPESVLFTYVLEDFLFLRFLKSVHNYKEPLPLPLHIGKISPPLQFCTLLKPFLYYVNDTCSQAQAVSYHKFCPEAAPSPEAVVPIRQPSPYSSFLYIPEPAPFLLNRSGYCNKNTIDRELKQQMCISQCLEAESPSSR